MTIKWRLNSTNFVLPSASPVHRYRHPPRRRRRGGLLHDRPRHDGFIPQVRRVLPRNWRSQGKFQGICKYTFLHTLMIQTHFYIRIYIYTFVQTIIQIHLHVQSRVFICTYNHTLHAMILHLHLRIHNRKYTFVFTVLHIIKDTNTSFAVCTYNNHTDTLIIILPSFWAFNQPQMRFTFSFCV